MEVEAHAVSAFDLNHAGNFPAYSFSGVSASSDEPLSDQMLGAREDSSLPPSPAARCPSNAAKNVQKVYRSYRTRRMLADSAVVAEELWYFDFLLSIRLIFPTDFARFTLICMNWWWCILFP